MLREFEAVRSFGKCYENLRLYGVLGKVLRNFKARRVWKNYVFAKTILKN